MRNKDTDESFKVKEKLVAKRELSLSLLACSFMAYPPHAKTRKSEIIIRTFQKILVM